MGKIWGRISLSEGETAQRALVAFFKNLNSDNSIHIQQGTVSIAGNFDEGALAEMAEALGSYKNIEFHYGKPITDWNIEDAELTPPQPEGENEVLVVSQKREEHCEQIHAEVKTETQSSFDQLTKIAQESSSFEEILDKVVMWLGLKKRRDIFAAIVRVARDTKKATWNEIENKLKAQGISMSPYDKRDIANAIRQKTGATAARNFIKAVAAYQTSDFPPYQISAEAVKCAGHKELGIFTEMPKIEEALQTLQDNWSLPDKVTHILKAIGLEGGVSEQDGIVDQLVRALQAEDESNLENIGALAEFLGKDLFEAMQYSNILNDALKSNEYHSVKITDFIKGLREVL